jgi:hypothetical protein
MEKNKEVFRLNENVNVILLMMFAGVLLFICLHSYFNSCNEQENEMINTEELVHDINE